MSGHTPGPWEHEEGDISHRGAIIAQVLMPRDFPCFDPEEHDMEEIDAQREADGDLIAAAPDLLAAAEDVLKLFGRDKVSLFNMSDEQHARFNALLRLSAATRKAKGEVG